MKLSFSTLGCPGRSLAEIVALANRFGIRGLEIRGVGGVMDADDIPDFKEDMADESNKLLHENGLQIISFGTSCSFHDEERLTSALDAGRAAIDVCRRMEIPAIRVFGNKIEPHESQNAIISRVGGAIGLLCDYGEPRGVDILLEVHGDFNREETLMPVIEQNRERPNFGIIWDIAHSDMHYGSDWRTFYEVIAPYIRHIHIKDHIKTGGGKARLTLVGEGEIEISDIIDRLVADRYDGWYSLEWEKKWVPELPEIEEALPGFIELFQKYSSW